MSTLRGLLIEAGELAGVPISDRDFIRHYNNCLNDLSNLYDTAKATATEIIVCDDAKIDYPLSNRIIGIKRVENSNKLKITDFEVVDDNSIRFFYRDTFTVYENVLHTPIASIGANDTTVLNPAYERCIPVYIAAQAVKKKDKDTYKELMADFAEYAALANNSIRKNTNKYKTVAMGRFR